MGGTPSLNKAFFYSVQFVTTYTLTYCFRGDSKLAFVQFTV